MAKINEVKGINRFDTTVKGDPGTGATLKKEGTDEHPYDPGLFAKLIDVSWGTHSTITGQFICVGWSDVSGGNVTLRLMATVDTDADDPAANTQFNKRGWITTFDKKIFIYATGQEERALFLNAMRVPLFGHAHVLIGGGMWYGAGRSSNSGLVACSINNGKTWIDLRYPANDPTDADTFTVEFLAYDPASRTVYAAAENVRKRASGAPGYMVLYRFTPGASPTAPGGWTLVKSDSFTPALSVIPPTHGYPPLPTDIVPAGSWIINSRAYYDDGLGGYNYWGTGTAIAWYNGKVVFTGADGNEHTLEQKANEQLKLDGELLLVNDPRFGAFGNSSAGNGMIVMTAQRFFDPPDYTGPIDAGQRVLIGSADLGVTWDQISPHNITLDFFYAQACFGKNKL